MTPHELPPKFIWRPEKSGGRLYAVGTIWGFSPTYEEHIGSVWPNTDGTWHVTAWRLIRKCEGGFEDMATDIPTFENAFDYLWTLIQLGEVHFTFLEEK